MHLGPAPVGGAGDGARSHGLAAAIAGLPGVILASYGDTLRVLDGLQTDELCPCNWKQGEETLKAA